MDAVERIIPEPQPAPPPASVTPDAIPRGAWRRTVSPRGMLGAIAIGSIVLAVFASSDLPSWGEDLQDGMLTPTLRRFAGAWNAEMEQLGLTGPHEALRATMRWLRDRRWR